MQKIDRVTFGVLNKQDYERVAKVDPHMPDTRRYLAIPFEGKDVPSKSSEVRFLTEILDDFRRFADEIARF